MGSSHIRCRRVKTYIDNKLLLPLTVAIVKSLTLGVKHGAVLLMVHHLLVIVAHISSAHHHLLLLLIGKAVHHVAVTCLVLHHLVVLPNWYLLVLMQDRLLLKTL